MFAIRNCGRYQADANRSWSRMSRLKSTRHGCRGGDDDRPLANIALIFSNINFDLNSLKFKWPEAFHVEVNNVFIYSETESRLMRRSERSVSLNDSLLQRRKNI